MRPIQQQNPGDDESIWGPLALDPSVLSDPLTDAAALVTQETQTANEVQAQIVATYKLDPPPLIAPLLYGGKDRASTAWTMWLLQLYRRVGGATAGSAEDAIILSSYADQDNSNLARVEDLDSLAAEVGSERVINTGKFVTTDDSPFNGVATQPSYLDNLNGTVTIGSGRYSISSDPFERMTPEIYTIAGGVFTPADGVTSYLVADYNDGLPFLRIITDVSLINEITIVPVRTFFRTGTEIHQLDWDTLGIALANKINQSIVKTQRFRRQDGLVLSDAATRIVKNSAGTVWYGATSLLLNTYTSATDELQLYYKVAGVWTKSANLTQYNNTQYNDGTNIQTLGTNRYAVNWIYRVITNTHNHCYILLGSDDYVLNDATNSSAPGDLPPEVAAVAVLVGRIIIQKNASVATQIDSAFTTQFATATAIAHNDLSGLQGGTANEYYHATAAEYTGTGTGVLVRRDSPVFATKITTPYTVYEKTPGNGIKVDTAVPTYPWADLLGPITARGVGATDPAWNVYIGGIRQYQFTVNDEVWLDFHLPHDYLPGSDIYIHAHWSHASALVTGGSTTWGFETISAKGHQQQAFQASITATVAQAANTTRYMHMIAEIQLSATSPTVNQIANSTLEPDSVIKVRCFLSANAITVSSGLTPEPFLHFCDIHYQSTGIGTKQKAPNFYV